jgi:N-acetylglucosaminyl-diphospho-decaprenol L-rhamnosyltransferase
MHGAFGAGGVRSEPSHRSDFTGRRPEVTAVVVTHNSARHLADLGHALSSGSLSPTRMLVVDNASRDDSVACARSSGFDVCQMASNTGFGAACNVGLRAALTEFALFCNPDIVPSPGALDRLVGALVSRPSAAVAGAALRAPVEARRFSRLTGNLWHFLPPVLKQKARRYKPTWRVDDTRDHVPVDFAEGAFILCRVTPLLDVGGFDECFFLYSEEEDLCRRLGLLGWETLLVPSAIVAHGYSESTENVDKQVMAPFRLHSLYWYYRRYHSRAYAEVARSMLAICIAIDRAYRAVSGREQIYGRSAALAPFRSMDAILRDYERGHE